MNATPAPLGLPVVYLVDDEDVLLIQQLIAERRRLEGEIAAVSNAAIAEKFGCAAMTVANIAAGRTWSSVRHPALVPSPRALAAMQRSDARCT